MNFLEKISTLNGTYYEWNDTMKNIDGKFGSEYGLIAQEVRNQFPEMVSQDENGYLMVDYIQLIPVIIESIKELKSEIDTLKNK
jgi:hypothetical protein